MYPGEHLMTRSDQPALIMSGTGERMSYAALEARTNRLARLLRAKGLNREDRYAILMENNARNNACYIETCGAGERAGLHYTCVNSFPTADELAKAKGHVAAAQPAEAAEAKSDMVIDILASSGACKVKPKDTIAEMVEVEAFSPPTA
jgi:long-chain acyl-CoA synthetase